MITILKYKIYIKNVVFSIFRWSHSWTKSLDLRRQKIKTRNSTQIRKLQLQQKLAYCVVIFCGFNLVQPQANRSQSISCVAWLRHYYYRRTRAILSSVFFPKLVSENTSLCCHRAVSVSLQSSMETKACFLCHLLSPWDSKIHYKARKVQHLWRCILLSFWLCDPVWYPRNNEQSQSSWGPHYQRDQPSCHDIELSRYRRMCSFWCTRQW